MPFLVLNVESNQIFVFHFIKMTLFIILRLIISMTYPYLICHRIFYLVSLLNSNMAVKITTEWYDIESIIVLFNLLIWVWRCCLEWVGVWGVTIPFMVKITTALSFIETIWEESSLIMSQHKQALSKRRRCIFLVVGCYFIDYTNTLTWLNHLYKTIFFKTRVLCGSLLVSFLVHWECWL